MNKFTLFVLALTYASTSYAQRTPTHPLDIKDSKYADMPTFFPIWMPGTPPSNVSKIDDEFFISRVRPLERIKEGDYYVDSKVDPNRKLCLWVPLDDPTTQWKSLPRYCFEGDNFSLWSYVDIHGNWTSPWLRVSAGLTDVAHKNGVKVGCVMSIPETESVTMSKWASGINSKVLTAITEPEGRDNYKYAKKLVQLMKYYGIDGLGVNSEFYTSRSTMDRLINFFTICHYEAKNIDWNFQLHWYDGTNESGQRDFDSGLGSHNERMFGAAGQEVTDMMFANYNWTGTTLEKSENTAARLNRSSYDYYAGFDIQGRSLKNGYWKELLKSKISIGLWGAHAQSLLHQSATDDGTSDIAIQKAYLLKQELAFSGGNRNPAFHPDVPHSSTLANADLKSFHGFAPFLTAKSTIQQLPFVSRFNLGNGLSFRNEGKITFNHKWYNLGTQDFMPTWRWWITGKDDTVNKDNYEGLIKADLTFDDAYFGGSCLNIHGKTDFSRVKLFKTLLKVNKTDKISITYKMLQQPQTHAKLFVALKDKLTDYKEIAIPNAETLGEWTTFTAPLSQLGITDEAQIAMIGLCFEGSADNYCMNIGELAVRKAGQTFNPVMPQIKETEVLRGRYNQVDFKLRYAAKDEKEGEKTYNDEVDTWYYEILFQQKGYEEQVLTATPSWAAYVIDAPLVNGTKEREARFGVRAVAPDGLTKSEIAWTPYQNIAYDDPLNTIICNKAVIKPEETFTLKFEDELHQPAKTWKLINAQTGKEAFKDDDKTEVTLSLKEEGSYDLVITDSENKETTIRGKVQITPKETGAVPQITSLTANKETAKADEEVIYSFTADNGEGHVSRALAIADPNMFQIPASMQQGKVYSYALWFKADKFAHDKQGTNLINKNTIKDKWPHNNWGDLWVTIRPTWKSHQANEISFNTMGWTEHDSPNEKVMTTHYSITPGVWYHVVVTQTAEKLQTIYLNGKKVAEGTFDKSKRREDVARGDERIKASEPADIFIGGGGVYKSGFNGWIDEVQVWNKALTNKEVLQAMKGYTNNVPEGLQAYYTFETKNADGSFPNLGKGGQADGKLVALVGSGGENTSKAAYEQQNADNDIVGYPGIVGSLAIKANHSWTLEGSTSQQDTEQGVVATYSTMGKYNATLTVRNNWGEASLTKENIVEITTTNGIDAIQSETQFLVYPNPFVEQVNLRFAEAGVYTLNILSANGTLVQSTPLTAEAQQVIRLKLTDPKGMYVLQVIKNGRTYKTLKLIKQ